MSYFNINSPKLKWIKAKIKKNGSHTGLPQYYLVLGGKKFLFSSNQ